MNGWLFASPRRMKKDVIAEIENFYLKRFREEPLFLLVFIWLLGNCRYTVRRAAYPAIMGGQCLVGIVVLARRFCIG